MVKREKPVNPVKQVKPVKPAKAGKAGKTGEPVKPANREYYEDSLVIRAKTPIQFSTFNIHHSSLHLISMIPQETDHLLLQISL